MKHINYEIKARCPSHQTVRGTLKQLNADFVGTDSQLDTYFNCDKGRLKLRNGNIEKALIFYERPNSAGPKSSEVNLHLPQAQGVETLLDTLSAAYGVWRQVKKTREIYFVDNVKVHLDQLEGLGDFVEIEAMARRAEHTREKLRQQCEFYMEKFAILPEHLIDKSYSDMIEAS